MGRPHRYLLVIALALAATSLLARVLLPAYVSHKLASPPPYERALSVLSERFERALQFAHLLTAHAHRDGYAVLFEKLAGDLGHTLRHEGIAIFILENGQPRFWSESMDIGAVPSTGKPVGVLVQNVWCVAHTFHSDGLQTVVLIKIKHQYAHQNQFLQNRFHHSLDFLHDFSLAERPSAGSHPVSISLGEQEFTINITPKYLALSERLEEVNLLLLWLGIHFLLIALYFAFWHRALRRHGNASTLLLAMLVVGVRLVALTGLTPALGHWDLFSPRIFAYAWYIPSLADLFINSLALFALACYAYSNLSLSWARGRPARSTLVAAALLIVPMATLYVTDRLLSILVINSTETFEAYRIFDLSIHSLLGYLSITLWFAMAIVLLHGAMRWVGQPPLGRWAGLWAACAGGTLLLFWGLDALPSAHGILLSVALVWLTGRISFLGEHISIRQVMVIVSLFSLYSVLYIAHLADRKDLNIRRVLAVNLGNERDPVAEVLFPSLSRSMLADARILGYLGHIDGSEEPLTAHIFEHYLSGYFKKYDFQLTVCLPTSRLRVEGWPLAVRCYDFFEEMLNEQGLRIPGTGFFHLNNQNGRISYLGILEYVLPDGQEISIFLELDSKLDRELPGYPELLIEGSVAANPILSQYSTAKFLQGQLIARSGEYNYSFVSPFPADTVGHFDFVDKNQFNHLVYNSEGNIQIVVSRPNVGVFNITASFAWIFLFFYITLLLWFKAGNLPVQLNPGGTHFKNRIQRVMIQILLLSLLMVGSVTIAYNIKSLQIKNYEDLSEKLMSAMLEVERNLVREDLLNPRHSDLVTSYLIHLSNVFHTDINLYDTTGLLLASSRPEVFARQLLGNKMNPLAWEQMYFQHSAKMVHTEQIGTMRYISAYVPLFDANNRLMAFLNLPYFTRQDEFIRSAMAVIVALINIYALLILFTLLVAIIVSNQITRPLALIRERMRMINFGRQNETIRYEANDEIGQLVREYNRMVKELARSAEELAQSQRQSAWQDMAKQVAHEIKNPLTPMTLTLQHLIRSQGEGGPQWEQRFQKFSASLLEQIHTLSEIATEFAHFAKMPVGRYTRVHLNTVVNDAVNLFLGYPSIDVINATPNAPNAYIYADSEQMMRVLVNLLRNATQAIPRDRAGQVTVHIRLPADTSWVEVMVGDNGMGIPPEQLPKMFTPNFTTKSGGMGIGLAIAKGIVEGFGGSIGFETKNGQGTTFFIRLPLLNERLME